MSTSDIFGNKASRIIEDIGLGNYDDHLGSLSNAIFARKKEHGEERATINLATLKPGDLVKIVGAMKPKYLRGQHAKVLDDPPPPNRREGYISIELLVPQQRFHIIDLPAQLVEKVQA